MGRVRPSLKTQDERMTKRISWPVIGILSQLCNSLSRSHFKGGFTHLRRSVARCLEPTMKDGQVDLRSLLFGQPTDLLEQCYCGSQNGLEWTVRWGQETVIKYLLRTMCFSQVCIEDHRVSCLSVASTAEMKLILWGYWIDWRSTREGGN